VKITGHTRAYAVLGHPVRHTRSPAFQNAGLLALGEDAVYLAFDAPPEEVVPLLQSMATLGFRGANLTIPHKEIAFRSMDILSPEALRAGSVNTVVFLKDGRLEGHSTDAPPRGRRPTAARAASFSPTEPPPKRPPWQWNSRKNVRTAP